LTLNNATIALYTDGLVEGRTPSLDDGLTARQDALSSALARPRGALGVPARGLPSCCARMARTTSPSSSPASAN